MTKFWDHIARGGIQSLIIDVPSLWDKILFILKRIHGRLLIVQIDNSLMALMLRI